MCGIKSKGFTHPTIPTTSAHKRTSGIPPLTSLASRNRRFPDKPFRAQPNGLFLVNQKDEGGVWGVKSKGFTHPTILTTSAHKRTSGFPPLTSSASRNAVSPMTPSERGRMDRFS